MRYGSKADENQNDAEGLVTETLLWENQNPTSTFNGQDVTLSESARNFTYLKIEYRAFGSTTDEDQQGIATLDMSVAYKGDYTQNSILYALGGHGTSYNYTRVVRFTDIEDETFQTLHFYACYQNTGTGTGNNYCVPLAIYGVTGTARNESSGGGGSSDIPIYYGQYTVIPSPDTETVLNTTGKQMLGEVKVEKIPYYETSNVYGSTVYIGVPEE